MPNASKARTKWALREVSIAIVVAVVAISVLFVLNRSNPELTLSGNVISLDVADDLSERQLGLSGRTNLGDDEGMLFVFDDAGRHGFWMKDMNFSIDILWLDESGVIVDIAESVAPNTYPEIFYPSLEASYVLEVPAGIASANEYDIGDRAEIRL